MAERPGRESEIVIVGAGPAGLSTAHFLKKRGFRRVTVLERLGRVGGLCFTVTEDYRCFDLGANYVTPAYEETLALAAELGVSLYSERNFVIVDPSTRPPYRTPWQAAKGEAPAVALVADCVRYLRLRSRLAPIIDPPGLKGISGRPDLCKSFRGWLQDNGLVSLQTLFEMPITVMGYGGLDEIPAPYALKYMSTPTFRAMCAKAFPLTNWWPWPKRFSLGYQWLFEVLARQLNVWLGIDIQRIARKGSRLRIEYRRTEQRLHETVVEEDAFDFDFLVLACPLTLGVLARFLDLSDEERRLFQQVVQHSYCMTTLKAHLPEVPSTFAMAALPLPSGLTPLAITKQMADSNFYQFYTRVDPSQRGQPGLPGLVRNGVNEFVAAVGGQIESDDNWHSFDEWAYFKHVPASAIAAGFYDALENLQGERRTYYTGGLLNFELVESILAYSKHLVEQRFAGA